MTAPPLARAVAPPDCADLMPPGTRLEAGWGDGGRCELCGGRAGDPYVAVAGDLDFGDIVLCPDCADEFDRVMAPGAGA